MKQKELFKSMQVIVDKHVEAYKSDFDIDMSILDNHPTGVWAWIVRDHGTHMVSLVNNHINPVNYIDAIKENFRSGIKDTYIIEKHNSNYEMTTANLTECQQFAMDHNNRYDVRFRTRDIITDIYATDDDSLLETIKPWLFHYNTDDYRIIAKKDMDGQEFYYC